MKNKPKFVICSLPEEFAGGTLVLFLLCKILNDKGYNAKIFLCGQFPKQGNILSLLKWYKYTAKYHLMHLLYRLCGDCRFISYDYALKNKQLRCPYKLTPKIDDNTIVVYPEIVAGNPLNASKVVRWLLHKPGFHSGVVDYNPTDLFFSFSKYFNDTEWNPLCRMLRVVHFNTDLWRQYNFGKRDGTCYILRKGLRRDDLPTEFDGPIIDDYSFKEISEVLNKYKYCVSYDTKTFFSAAASICGCISIVVPEKNVSKLEWQPEEHLRVGVAYGFEDDEINNAILTRDLVVKRYVDILDVNSKNVDYFILECESYWL